MLREFFAKNLGWSVVQMNAEDNTKVDMHVAYHKGDHLMSYDLDSKWCGTPCPPAKSNKHGLTKGALLPLEHFTLDQKDVKKYSADTRFVFVVDYTRCGLPTKGLFFIKNSAAMDIMTNKPERCYVNESNDKKQKIAKVAIAMSECTAYRLGDMTPAETFDYIFRACHPLDVKVGA